MCVCAHVQIGADVAVDSAQSEKESKRAQRADGWHSCARIIGLHCEASEGWSEDCCLRSDGIRCRSEIKATCDHARSDANIHAWFVAVAMLALSVHRHNRGRLLAQTS